MTLIDQAVVYLIRFYNVANWLSSSIFGFSLRDGWTFGDKDDFEFSAHRHKVLIRSMWGVEEDAQVK